MKKILAFLLAAVMLLSLAACGSEPAEEETPAPAESEAPSGEEPSGEEPSGEGEHEPVTLRVYVRYSDDDTILPYDYAVEWLTNFEWGANFINSMGQDALCWFYSFVYNLSYMLPETILTVIGALILYKAMPKLFARQA